MYVKIELQFDKAEWFSTSSDKKYSIVNREKSREILWNCQWYYQVHCSILVNTLYFNKTKPLGEIIEIIMWKTENRAQFEEIVADLLRDPDVQSMKDLPQHSKTVNCFDHSLYVAYMSFLICRRFNLDYVAAARGGLLHDFALCNWEEDDAGIGRLWEHPHMALANAQARYDLTDLEEDIIVKHMWPLTLPLPKHKESFVVSMADKICAVMEMSRLYNAFKVKKHLSRAMA